MTRMSAREFNQQVSRARQAALEDPVFITERGQPKHVLLSIEAYEALTGNHRPIADLLHLEEDLELELPKASGLARAAEFD
ncbi:type II toxin-antitoxin system Phd/YefM family antitoxin [Deinococcus detaillensis]|uniref:Antitoxin n=1 Tax=Deinococcus detaillensis TaxID=2592048 RepID=A0A553UMJ3_9DEIO|nr:type II toxin-antitoxin system prevent-host-death family antitoxin [Deinococcus detaillensis]TSA81442.1 type II toxin-antitoxin system Phd/YefM family antitoxin [Deinococcus detaillensis]